MSDQTPNNSDLELLEQILANDPAAQERFARLKDYKKEMCFRWIAEAEDPQQREMRVRHLARRLWLTSFDPYYDLSDVQFAELDRLYGEPRPFNTLPPAEQALALQENRVLGAYHYRNFDDGGTTFYIATSTDKLLDDVLMVYERPCVLTERIIGWLDRNNIETMREVRAMFGLE